MMSFDLVKYSSRALLSVGGVYAYDYFVDNKSNVYTMRDAYTIAISSVVSEVAAEVISGFLPYLSNKQSFTGMLFTPVLNGAVYMYLYNYMVEDTFRGNRDSTKAFLVASMISLLVGYVENPLSSLF